MTDRELLELAAKAADITIDRWHGDGGDMWQGEPRQVGVAANGRWVRWNPLTSDADAFRLAVKLRLEIDHSHRLDNDLWVMASQNGLMAGPSVEIEDEAQRLAATRRVIVRAAAAIAQGGNE